MKKYILLFLLLLFFAPNVSAEVKYFNLEDEGQHEKIKDAINSIQDLVNSAGTDKINPYIKDNLLINLNNPDIYIGMMTAEEEKKYAGYLAFRYKDSGEIHISKDLLEKPSDFQAMTIGHEFIHTIKKFGENSTYGEGKAYAFEYAIFGINSDIRKKYYSTSFLSVAEEENLDPPPLKEIIDIAWQELLKTPFGSVIKWISFFFNDYPDESFSIDSTSYPVNPSFISDISATILMSPFWKNADNLLYSFKRGTALTDENSSPQDWIDTAPALIIPSGGLFGLDNSDIFKAKLEEYVKAGGTVICFSQQHGYEFSALPGGKLSGYGWLEDQACHANAVYIDTYHQILSGQTKSTPDFSVDGYFTNLPDNATVLLRRTANGQPCMITYPYGEGRVIATTMYEDWGYAHNQSTVQGRALVRDMISWIKSVSHMTQDTSHKLEEYKPTDTVNLTLSIKNSVPTFQSELPSVATQVKAYILSPDRNVLSTQVITVFKGAITAPLLCYWGR